MLFTQLLSFSAEIDDMSICYVLREGDNATSDIFYFTIEDNGKFFYSNCCVSNVVLSV